MPENVLHGLNLLLQRGTTLSFILCQSFMDFSLTCHYKIMFRTESLYDYPFYNYLTLQNIQPSKLKIKEKTITFRTFRKMVL